MLAGHTTASCCSMLASNLGQRCLIVLPLATTSCVLMLDSQNWGNVPNMATSTTIECIRMRQCNDFSNVFETLPIGLLAKICRVCLHHLTWGSPWGFSGVQILGCRVVVCPCWTVKLIRGGAHTKLTHLATQWSMLYIPTPQHARRLLRRQGWALST